MTFNANLAVFLQNMSVIIVFNDLRQQAVNAFFFFFFFTKDTTLISVPKFKLLAQGRWISPASSTTKTGRHDIAEILL